MTIEEFRLLPEPDQRREIVDEARSWGETPYVSRARLKGVGTDCGLFPYMVYRKFEIIPQFEIERLSDDWWMHTSEQKYLFMIQRHLRRMVETVSYHSVPDSLPGSLVLTKGDCSKVYNHAAIITAWPMVIHAVPPKVVEINASLHSMWGHRQIVIFDPWRKPLPEVSESKYGSPIPIPQR